MKNFLFILLLSFPIVIFAQRGNNAWEQQTTSYAPNDIGEEYNITIYTRQADSSLLSEVYNTRLFGDFSSIGPFILDSTMTKDILFVRAIGSFALDIRYGVFVYHDVEGITNVFTYPTKVMRVEHERSCSIYYKFYWGECYDEKKNCFPEMTVELVHRYGSTCIKATSCNCKVILNYCNDEKIKNLWDVFSPLK